MALARTGTAAAGAAFALSLMTSAGAAGMTLGHIGETPGPKLILAQWVYGPYGRPYWAGPYSYGPRVWARRGYYRPFGPGAIKQRNRTRLDYCISKPERC